MREWGGKSAARKTVNEVGTRRQEETRERVMHSTDTYGTRLSRLFNNSTGTQYVCNEADAARTQLASKIFFVRLRYNFRTHFFSLV